MHVYFTFNIYSVGRPDFGFVERAATTFFYIFFLSIKKQPDAGKIYSIVHESKRTVNLLLAEIDTELLAFYFISFSFSSRRL